MKYNDMHNIAIEHYTYYVIAYTYVVEFEYVSGKFFQTVFFYVALLSCKRERISIVNNPV